MKQINGLLIILLTIAFLNCKKNVDKAQTIVDDSILAHGGKNYEKFTISFNFRDIAYILSRNLGDFKYERIQKDTLNNETQDVYSNDKIERILNGKIQVTPDTMLSKYKNSINSVAYFSLLPYLLNDEAVNKTFIGTSTIGGQKYNKIKVNFGEKNGGKDHDDEYVYWFNDKTKFLDYFAYSYKVDGGGIRFREKISDTLVAGIRFQNYINYEPIDNKYKLEDLDKAFTEGTLQEFSRIENKNIKAIK